MATVRFQLNRKGVRALLNSDGVADAVRAVAERAAPPGTSVEMRRGATRVEARIVDRSDDALDREAQTGHLSRALGQAAR